MFDNKELRKVHQETILDLMKTNDKIVMLDADLVSASGSKPNFDAFPDRCINVGISEANMVSSAAGLSLTGLRPYIHTFAPFATRRVFDQIYMSGVYSHNNFHIYGSDPGFWAQHNGGTHTTYEDIALMCSLPRMVVTAPADAYGMDWVLREYLKHDTVFYTRATRKGLPLIYDESSTFELGKVNILREGKDAVVFAIGIMVSEALKAAEKLAEEGIEITVVDSFSLKPFDEENVARLAQTHPLVISAENHSRIGGLGSLVSTAMSKVIDTGIHHQIAVNDAFGEVGLADYLQEKHHLTASAIVDVIKNNLVD